MSSSKIYERMAAAGAAGKFLRPGGLALTETALSRCSFSPGARILDVGCGSGGTVEWLIHRHGLRAAGVDPSPFLLKHGIAENDRLPLVVAAGESLPFGDSQWDGVFVECSLSLAEDIDRVLEECHRVLTDDGRLVLSDVYARGSSVPDEIRSLLQGSCIAGMMTGEELTEKLRTHGFVVTFWEDHTPALKEFLAQLIFSHGSCQQFWCPAGSEDGTAGGPNGIGKALADAGPGYFLSVNRKLTEAA